MAERMSASSFSLSQGFWTKFCAPDADGVDDVVHLAVGGDHDYRQRRVALADQRQNFQSVLARQSEVQQDKVIESLLDALQSVFAIDCRFHHIAFERQAASPAIRESRLRHR